MVRETRHLWVGNLPENIREDRIREHFKRYGRVQSVKLLPGSNGSFCAAVAFMDIKSASKAHNSEQKLDEHALSTEYYEPSAYSTPQPRFPISTSEEHTVLDRTSHFYERSCTPVAIGTPTPRPEAEYLRRTTVYHGPPDPTRGRPRDRIYRNGPPYAPGTESRSPVSHRRTWAYDATATGVRYNSTEQLPTQPPPIQHEVIKTKRVRSGSESRSGSQSSRSHSPTHSTSDSPPSSDSSTRSESPRSEARTRVSIQSAVTPPSSTTTQVASTTLAVYSEDRRPLAICVRKLPIRSSGRNFCFSDTSLKDGLFHEYKKHGKVTWVKVVGNGNDRYALVCFKKPEDAEKAIEVSHDKLFFGCKIEVAPYHGYDVEDNEARPYDTELDEFHPKATRTLFIGNLEKEITAVDIRQHFDQFGEIIEIDIKKQSGVNSSYAFCQYADIGSVVKAIRTLDGEPLGESRLKLGFGKSMASSCVWVAGVAEQASDKYLDLQFRKFGLVTHVVVDRERGQALIFYEQVASAAAAVKEMRGLTLRGRRLQVDFASRECQEAFYERLDQPGRDWGLYEPGRPERERYRYDSATRVRSRGSGGSRTPRRHEGYETSPRYRSYEDLSPSDYEEYTTNEPSDLRHLHKERNHLQHLLDQLDSRPLRSVTTAADQNIVVTTHNHRRRLSSHRRSSGDGPAPVCKRRKTGSTSEDERRRHHHHHSGDESRPGTPLVDEKPEEVSYKPQEPRRIPRDREGPLSLPLPMFAAQCFKNATTTNMTNTTPVMPPSSPPPASPVREVPPSSPLRPPSPSSTSSSEVSPQSPTLEERIKSLDEKYERWTGRAVQGAQTKPRHRLLDVNVQELQPSDIVKSVLAKPSVFDEDSKRLENFGEKYEPRDFASYSRAFENRFIPGDPRNTATYIPNLSVKVSPLNSPSTMSLSPCPAAKGLQYPFPSHPPVQPTTSVATTTAGSPSPPTKPISRTIEFSVQKAESWLGITKSVDSSTNQPARSVVKLEPVPQKHSVKNDPRLNTPSVVTTTTVTTTVVTSSPVMSTSDNNSTVSVHSDSVEPFKCNSREHNINSDTTKPTEPLSELEIIKKDNIICKNESTKKNIDYRIKKSSSSDTPDSFETKCDISVKTVEPGDIKISEEPINSVKPYSLQKDSDGSADKNNKILDEREQFKTGNVKLGCALESEKSISEKEKDKNYEKENMISREKQKDLLENVDKERKKDREIEIERRKERESMEITERDQKKEEDFEKKKEQHLDALDRRKDVDKKNNECEKIKKKDKEEPERIEKEKKRDKDKESHRDKEKSKDSEKHRKNSDEKRKETDVDVDKHKDTKKKERSSLPGSILGKRRVSSQDSYESAHDDLKRAKSEHRRRDSKDSRSSSNGKHKTHENNRSQEHKSGPKLPLLEYSKPKLPVDDKIKSKEYLQKIKVKVEKDEHSLVVKEIRPTKDVSEKHHSDNDEERKKEHREKKKLMSKSEFGSTESLDERKSIKKEKRNSTEKKREDVKRNKEKPKSEIKGENGVDTATDSDSEPKKHSIFDIVIDEPYVSMYDKVKARSCKNMQKQEEEKRQEKLKEKFTQLKQSRAKREEKKRSTSWEEDTDSDASQVKRMPRRSFSRLSSEDEGIIRRERKLTDSSWEENRRKKHYDTSEDEAFKLKTKALSDVYFDEDDDEKLYKKNKNKIKNMFESSEEESPRKTPNKISTKPLKIENKNKIRLSLDSSAERAASENKIKNKSNSDIVSEGEHFDHMSKSVERAERKKSKKKDKRQKSVDGHHTSSVIQSLDDEEARRYDADSDRPESDYNCDRRKLDKKDRRRSIQSISDDLDDKLKKKKSPKMAVKFDKQDDFHGTFSEDSDHPHSLLKNTPSKWHVSQIYGTDSESNTEVITPVIEKSKKSKEKKKKKNREPSDEIIKAGLALENMLASPPSRRSSDELHNTEDSFVEKVKSNREKKKKRKKSRDEKSSRHHHHHSHHEKKTSSENHEPKLPTLPSLVEVQAAIIKTEIESDAIHPPKNHKKVDKLIPGFGLVDEKLHESAVKSISQMEVPKLEPKIEPKHEVEERIEIKKEDTKERTVISQEETEDAVAALLGETFSYSSHYEGSPLEQSEPTEQHDEEELNQAVQSLNEGKPGTPQSEADLQIDTDVEEQDEHFHGLRFDQLPRTPDVDLTKPPKTPDISPSYLVQSKPTPGPRKDTLRNSREDMEVPIVNPASPDIPINFSRERSPTKIKEADLKPPVLKPASPPPIEPISKVQVKSPERIFVDNRMLLAPPPLIPVNNPTRPPTTLVLKPIGTSSTSTLKTYTLPTKPNTPVTLIPTRPPVLSPVTPSSTSPTKLPITSYSVRPPPPRITQVISKKIIFQPVPPRLSTVSSHSPSVPVEMPALTPSDPINSPRQPPLVHVSEPTVSTNEPMPPRFSQAHVITSSHSIFPPKSPLREPPTSMPTSVITETVTPSITQPPPSSQNILTLEQAKSDQVKSAEFQKMVSDLQSEAARKEDSEKANIEVKHRVDKVLVENKSEDVEEKSTVKKTEPDLPKVDEVRKMNLESVIKKIQQPLSIITSFENTTKEEKDKLDDSLENIKPLSSTEDEEKISNKKGRKKLGRGGGTTGRRTRKTSGSKAENSPAPPRKPGRTPKANKTSPDPSKKTSTDVYEFHDESDEEGEEIDRPRLILTIKSPNTSKDQPSVSPKLPAVHKDSINTHIKSPKEMSMSVKSPENHKELIKSPGKSPQNMEKDASGNTRKSRRLQEKDGGRTTVDDTIDDVIRNMSMGVVVSPSSLSTVESKSPRRSTRQSPRAVQPAAGRKGRGCKKQMKADDEEFKPTSPIRTPEPSIEKPTESKPKIIRASVDNEGSSDEATTLIDPVTGMLMVMKVQEEGQYVPVPNAQPVAPPTPPPPAPKTESIPLVTEGLATHWLTQDSMKPGVIKTQSVEDVTKAAFMNRPPTPPKTPQTKLPEPMTRICQPRALETQPAKRQEPIITSEKAKVTPMAHADVPKPLLERRNYADKIAHLNDQMLAQTRLIPEHIQVTPTDFVKTPKYSNIDPVKVYPEAIKSEFDLSRELLRKGAPADAVYLDRLVDLKKAANLRTIPPGKTIIMPGNKQLYQGVKALQQVKSGASPPHDLHPLTGAVASPPPRAPHLTSQQPIVTGASSSRALVDTPKGPGASPRGLTLPPYEAALGDGVGMGPLSHHFIHPQMVYQQYLREALPGMSPSPYLSYLSLSSASLKLEERERERGAGDMGRSPPLELRRPLSRDRTADSPTVYMGRHLPRYYDEPPPAHLHVPRHLHAVPDAPGQPRLQVATPPHASQVPPQADSLLMLLQRYPIMWQGLLALKNDQSAVQMHFVFGNPDVARDSLPCNSDGSTPPLRIAQRMRLEQTQLEGVARKMQMDNEHCMLLALPCGRDHMDVLQQSTNLTTGFITYLQQKQAAGIVNIAQPGSQQAAYVVHIFPSCEFTNENLARNAPDLLHRMQEIPHLVIVIATV